MLPILDAISFYKVLTEGGRTQPWLIYVKVNNSREPYVVKLFTADEVDNTNALAHEIFCTVLARQFDLSVPDAALIRFSKDFIQTLPTEISNILFSRDNRLKFGCKYKANTTLLLKDLPGNQLNKIINDLDTIYAFDNFINNRDRGIYKTNLLISTESNDYYIIDHEKSFKNIDSLLDDVTINNFTNFIESHVLHKYLSHSKHKNKLFDSFNEYLSRLNTSILDPYYDQLKENDIQYIKFDKLKMYLYKVKSKGEWLSNCLLNNL
jgi:hypothetical protein